LGVPSSSFQSLLPVNLQQASLRNEEAFNFLYRCVTLIRRKKKLSESLENYIIFTTFIKVYSEESIAMRDFKTTGEHAFMYDVVFSNKKFENELEFGLYCDPKRRKGQDVIFNIYNFLKD
jgi:hypothetical protein